MYYFVINGSQQGPYPVDKAHAMLASGEVRPDTPTWTEGQADWQPLDRILATPQSPPPIVAPAKSSRLGMFSFLSGVGMTLAVVGAILIVLLLVVGSFIGYMVYVGNGLDKSSKDYVDQAIPAIVTGWSQDELTKRESKAFQKATNDEELAKLFTVFQRLGTLKSYDGCKGEANVNYTPQTGKVITASYLGRATFENSEAEIKVDLIQEDGAWKIQGFRINSPFFLK